MNWKGFFASLLITLVLVFFFNRKWGSLPPLGKLLSPQTGFWQNAEPVAKDFSDHIQIPGVKAPVKVWLDERMVPHVFAQNDQDAYYVQGYLTARARLWQMEMQIRAAGGYVSEILGAKAVSYDRHQRRKGMVSAAEKTLAAMEADTATKAMIDAYREGVNAYIHSLDYSSLPLEYKLLDYKPEDWTNLKTALLIKYLGDYLTGYTEDLKYTNALHHFSPAVLNKMFPVFPDTLFPVVPKGTPFYNPSVNIGAAPADSLWKIPFSPTMPDKDNGSNNWAVGAKRTASGAAILCNDPHLGLNLPSLWYEIQLCTPDMNVYGVSLPGAPGVVIGFNKNIAWGLTNAMRDVKDFYAIRFKDASRKQYWYDSSWKNTRFRIEKINVLGSDPYYDTVAYTVFGPVIYEKTFPDTVANVQSLAVHWAANDSTNELKSIALLNHAKNYHDFKNAMKYFDCPGQNFVFADVTGNVGIWEQGKFPVRWKDQGKFVMPGTDDTYNWRGYIPTEENPNIFAPEQGFVFSANQNPTDSTYPYPYFGNFVYYRAEHIARFLKKHDKVSIKDMMQLQTSYYSAFAATALPYMLQWMNKEQLTGAAGIYMDSLQNWHYNMVPGSMKPTLFYLWWKNLKHAIWYDDLHYADSLPLPVPSEKTTIEWLIRDSAMPFVDNRNTTEKENLQTLVQQSFLQAVDSLSGFSSDSLRIWGNYQGTAIQHLTGIAAFSHSHLFTGGSRLTVNANKKDEDGKSMGPSWRMIVQMSSPIVAYGVYPGGQSGNPGSRYYDDFIPKWEEGTYYKLHFLMPKDSGNAVIRYRIRFSGRN